MRGRPVSSARRARRFLAAFIAMLSLSPIDAAAGQPRPLFEPTDLDLEEVGVAELNFQSGVTRGDPSRLVLTDYELDLGVADKVELGLDSSYWYEGPPGGGYSPRSPAYDPLWVSVKLGFLNARHPAEHRAWAFATQIGPRVSLSSSPRSAGYEGLLLLGRAIGTVQLVLNLGGVVDATSAKAPHRAAGIEGGIDAVWFLDAAKKWSLLGELAFLRFFSGDPHQLTTTAGVGYSVTPWLDVSIIGLAGLVDHGDRFGVLFGVAPKMRLWR